MVTQKKTVGTRNEFSISAIFLGNPISFELFIVQ